MGAGAVGQIDFVRHLMLRSDLDRNAINAGIVWNYLELSWKSTTCVSSTTGPLPKNRTLRRFPRDDFLFFPLQSSPISWAGSDGIVRPPSPPQLLALAEADGPQPTISKNKRVSAPHVPYYHV
jgi:hypothetical protein